MIERIEAADEIDGYIVPPPLADLPPLTERQAGVYDAWRTLSIGRPWSVGMTRAYAMPLPAGDILSTAEAYGFDGPAFLRLCRELDTVYLAHVNR